MMHYLAPVRPVRARVFEWWNLPKRRRNSPISETEILASCPTLQGMGNTWRSLEQAYVPHELPEQHALRLLHDIQIVLLVQQKKGTCFGWLPTQGRWCWGWISCGSGWWARYWLATVLELRWSCGFGQIGPSACLPMHRCFFLQRKRHAALEETVLVAKTLLPTSPSLPSSSGAYNSQSQVQSRSRIRWVRRKICC